MLRRPDGSCGPAEGALGRRADAAGRRDRPRRVRSATDFPQLVDGAIEFLARAPGGRGRAAAGTAGRPTATGPGAVRAVRRGPAAPDPGADARRGGVPRPARHPVGVAAGTLEHPFVFVVDGQEYRVGYLPAESDTGMFGGNSNWRGPVWLPINVDADPGAAEPARVLRRRLHRRVPDRLRPADDLYEVAEDISDRLIGAFRRDADGRRPVHGGSRAAPERPALARPAAVLRVPPRRQRRRDRRQPPDRLDRARRGAAAAVPRATAIDWQHGSRRRMPATGRRAARRVGGTDAAAAMTAGRTRPVIYEVNTAVWLDELSRARRAAGDARRRRPRPTGTPSPRRRRRGLADGRLGAQPGRARAWRAPTRS